MRGGALDSGRRKRAGHRPQYPSRTCRILTRIVSRRAVCNVALPEAFITGRARITAAKMKRRLPQTLEVAETRAREVYWATNADIEHVPESRRE